MADAGLHGLLLVGHRIQLPAGTPSLEVIEPLARLKLRLYGDGLLKDEGSGTNVLDGPVQAGQTWHTEIDAPGHIAGAMEGLTVRFK